ncbi:hypothetical protein V5T82_14160 [Magnetovibrio sp. PR-2]|uniref:hypothetical protein n=1 Tax=Magnetovibrio sp. PR-2 TaxID=3120356 RepID=UPI002FCE17FF
MCFGSAPPPPMPKVETPEEAKARREKEEKENKIEQNTKNMKRKGVSSMVNKKTGFLGVKDEDIKGETF